MIDSLGESAKLVLSYARAIATELRAELVETEHLFLGICELDDVGIRDAVRVAGLDLTAASASLRARLKQGSGRPDGDVHLSPEANEALKVAGGVATSLGERLIEAHDVLIALLGIERGIVWRTLEQLGVGRVLAQRRLAAMVDSGQATPPTFYSTRRSIAQSELSRTSRVLESLGRDLTDAAEQGRLSPIIGRDREMAELVQILLGKRKNNAVLIGAPGVGKTAVVEGLAQQIVAGRIPKFDGMRIRTIEVGALVAGTMYRGQFEQRLKDLIDEVRDRDDVILFIDEMHMLVGAGETGQGGSVDAANMLKPVLSEGSLKVIGATTTDEYRKYVEPDRALMRRFQPVVVGEPTREDTLTILRGLRPRYEEFHLVSIRDDALEAAVDLSMRYVHERQLPDKALDLIDRACTTARLQATNGEADDERPHVGEADIAAVISVMLEIPIARISADERGRLAEMGIRLRERVAGQNQAIDAISQAILRARTGFGSLDRPYGVFLFLGPTGVGKTKLAEEVAAYLFGDREQLIGFDMSQYADPLSVSELVGTKTGVVGWEEGGKLTNAVRARPYSVVLLDEIEKAHPHVWNLFLPIFDNGRITDALGRVIDFRNTVIILTSNVGAARFRPRRRIGFGADEAASGEEATADEVRAAVLDDLHEVFAPEFLNRIDEIVVFNPLGRDDLRAVVLRRIAETVPVRVLPSPEALELLVEASYDPAMGARPVRRAIQRLVANPLSMMIASGALTEGDAVDVSVADSRLAFTRAASAS